MARPMACSSSSLEPVANPSRGVRLLRPRLVGPPEVLLRHMEDMAYCDLCEMDQNYCVHGLGERRQAASANASILLVSPRNIAHFPECPHKRR
jgi:hypothetical protein